MKMHYLEIVCSNVDEICATYEKVHGLSFEAPDPLLGNARTAKMPDGGAVGIRGTLSDEEEYIVRPYFIVEDMDLALEFVKGQGGDIIHPPLEISGRGKFAIYSQGGVQQGLWQL